MQKNINEIPLTEEEKRKLLEVGVDVNEKDRAGTYMLVDNQIVEVKLLQKGVELLPLSMAFEKYEWLKDYYWKVVNKDKDEYTRKVFNSPPMGYLIRSLPGAHSKVPVQACFYLKSSNFEQIVHNIIIAEEDSELHVINGCIAANYTTQGSHIAVTEMYVKKNASITYTMIHDWAPEVIVRPRTGVLVGEKGNFISNYVSLKEVHSTQSAPIVYAVGREAKVKLYSILYAPEKTNLDIGGDIYLQGEGSSGEIVSRAVSNGGNIYTRGALIGEAKNIKAHMECSGIMLKDEGFIHTIPELKTKFQEVEMTHEAAVGKIAKDEIEYLMARGISEEDAISLILRGFLNVKIEGLPELLQRSIDIAVETSMKGM